MKFAFNRRVTVEAVIWVEAETEIEAWAHVLDETRVYDSSDEKIMRKPLFRRLPEEDDFAL